MDLDELKAALDSARERMLNEEDTNLSEKRRNNLDRYMGKPDGRERPGYSQYVTREVFEAVEWVMPALLRTFTAGDRVVEYEPVGPEDEQQAEQETDVVNHYLLKENNGFLSFYEWFWDLLIYPTAYAKVWVEEANTTRTEAYSGITEFQLQAISSTEGYEIVEASPYYHQVMTPQGPVEELCYDIKCKVTESKKKFKWAAVPPEQVGVDPECTSVDADEARFLRHASLRTKSDLLEMGYDPDLLDTVPTWSEFDEWNQERVNRHVETQEKTYDDEGLDETTGLYELEEWYVKVDFDGDGIAEGRKIDLIGGEIFENEEYDFNPIVACSAIPIPHRHDGMAFAEAVIPIQELSTFYQRSINDNIARTNRPRKYVNEQAITEDGLTVDQLQDIDSEIVILRGDPSQIQPESHQPVIQELLAVHKAVKDQVQMRTGVAPGIMMDADVLQRSTEGAYSDAMDAASQLVEKLTRIIAEVGLRKLMIKAHRLIKEHQDKPKTVKIRGQWIEANPTDWKDRENVTVNVGLGFDDRQAQKASAMEMIGMQMQMLPLGMADPKLIMSSLEDFVEAMGRKGVDRYFKLPPPPQPGQQQPDPLTMAQVQGIMAEMKRSEFKTQTEQARENFETQSEQQRKDAEMDAKLEGMNAKTQADIARAVEAYFKAGSMEAKAAAEQQAIEYGRD